MKDARAALDALREEHHEKLRRQAEEAERIRQMQMAHKLQIMRKKKQEYLQVSVSSHIAQMCSIHNIQSNCMCDFEFCKLPVVCSV